MKPAFFRIRSQEMYFARLIGAMLIIVGFALLITAVLNSVDSWRAVRDYSYCAQDVSPAYPEYSQLLIQTCQEAFYNTTGVYPTAYKTALSKSQQAQVLLNSIAKIFFALAVIFFGSMLYKPFPLEDQRKEKKGKKK